MPDKISDLLNPSLAGGKSTTLLLGTDGISSSMSVNTKSKLFQQKLNQMEQMLMDKMQNNFNGVRKAFLELDTDQDGFIDGEDLAKFLKNTNKSLDMKERQSGFNFTLLELLIKIRCNKTTT